jgi:hypothetical protein
VQQESLKSYAVKVLERNTAARQVCNTALDDVLQEGGTISPSMQHFSGGQKGPIPENVAPCGSSHCAGCYDVGERKIHPPKCGENYRKWLERWKPRGGTQ